MKKKSFCLKLLILVTISLVLSSCRFYTKNEQQEIIEMFNSFENTNQYVVSTHDQLRIGDTIIDKSNIKYNEQRCRLIILEEKGLYAYTCNEEGTELNILFITYEDLQIELVDKIAIPSRIFNATYSNNALYFLIDDPTTDELNQLFIVYDMLTKEVTTVDRDDVDVNFGTIDSNRPTKYQLTYNDKGFTSDSVDVTNRETGVKKKITKSLLDTFEEGKLIEKKRRIDPFDISKIFVKDDDFYIIGYFGLAPLGDPCFLYIWKWNFETEKAEYYTAIYFESFPESVGDLYIF